MTTGYSTALRNSQLDAITTSTGSLAKLRLYSGARPATGGPATILLAEFTLGSPYAPSASAGVLSPNLPSAATGVSAGTATWFRVVKSDGATQIIDGDIATTGADMNLNTTTISVGVSVTVTAWTVARGNA